MATVTPNLQKDDVKRAMPVMPCQTTQDGGSSKQLVRGPAPSTPRSGHPPRKGKRHLSELMFFRCTPEDKTTIRHNAEKTGLGLSSYMRMQSTGKPAMRAYRRVRADWQELQRCMGAINKAGNVVNQLVALLRRGSSHPDVANHALIELCKAARAIMAALGKE